MFAAMFGPSGVAQLRVLALSAHENPMVADFMQATPPKPYWGPRSTVPADRSFPEASSPYAGGDGNDHDIELWWGDLRATMARRGLIEA